MIKRPSSGFIVDKKYRLLERIGGGGMGDVFRAKVIEGGHSRFAMQRGGPSLGAQVAIKILHPELAGSSDIATRFFHEAKAVNRVRHPNIVEMIEVGTADVGPYLVMEYLEGESLGHVIARRGRIDGSAVVAIVVPVLEALHAAHRAGIIHRDLKPENVFLARTEGGVDVRLLDFGIAKVMAETTMGPKTRTGVVYGTPDYLSPEQATGEGPLDGRSDLFAVGVLAYELLTARRPFTAPTAVATAFRVVHADPVPLHEISVRVDPRLATFVARLLMKEPADRYQTAADASRALEALLPPVERRRESLRETLAKLAKRAESSDVRVVDSALPVDRPMTPPRPLVARGSGPFSPPAVSTPLADASVRPAPAPEREESETTIRPLPLEYRGRFQVLGVVINSVDDAVRLKFGEVKRRRVLDKLPAHYAADMRHDLINALVGYDLEVLDAYLQSATEHVLRDQLQWRYIGGMAVDGGLSGLLRSLARPAPLESVLRRGIPIWNRLMNFGAWHVEAKPSGRVAVQVDEFSPASLPLRLWLLGVIEELARRTQDCEVRVAVTGGDSGFSPTLSWELTPVIGSSAAM